jgi:phosphopantothenoylcysteine synthetase/decarboxylase
LTRITPSLACPGSMGDLRGRTVLVTAGPTRARIDAVRFVSSTSTGRLGAALADEALSQGAHVAYVHGPGAALPSTRFSERLRTVSITWVSDLFGLARAELEQGTFDVIIHAMAVLDYAPSSPHDAKTPSGAPRWQIALAPVPKLLPLLREWHPRSFIVGFKLGWALPEQELLKAARQLLERNRLQLVVANDLHLIGPDEHPAVILGNTGVVARAGTKHELARILVREVSRRVDI